MGVMWPSNMDDPEEVNPDEGEKRDQFEPTEITSVHPRVHVAVSPQWQLIDTFHSLLNSLVW